MLSVEQQSEILALYFGKRRSKRAIGRALGINRKSVAAVIARREVLFSPALRQARRSILDEFKPHIVEMLKAEPTLPSTAILQRLRENGYLGSYGVLKQWVAKQRRACHRSREAFLEI